MSDERKPLWPWIVAVVIGLPVPYVASIGPMFWIYKHVGAPMWMAQGMHYVYWPLVRLSEQSEVSEHLLLIYVSVWKDGF